MMLFAINSILYSFRNHKQRTAMYLEELAYSVKMSPDTYFGCKPGEVLLPTLAIVLMMAREVEKAHGGEDMICSFPLAEIIEFVELMMLTTSRTRDIVCEVLSSWLTSEVDCLSTLKSLGQAEQIVMSEVRSWWASKATI